MYGIFFREQGGFFGRSWPPVFIGDLRAGSNVSHWILVALHAVLHRERTNLHDTCHAADLAMTGDTPNAFMNVNAVIELHEIGQIVNACPV